jgi:hypothetical protein
MSLPRPALLAGIGAGVFADEVEASRRSYQSAARYEPDPERRVFYEVKYRSEYGWSRGNK